MSIGLDSEGLLAIYADWIVFLRAKKTALEAQRVKLQTRVKEKAPENGTPVQPHTLVPTGDTDPDWLFQGSVAEEAAASVALGSEAEEADEWM